MAAPTIPEPGVKGECDRELEWKEAARRDPKALCSLAFWQIRQPFQPRGNHIFRRPWSLEGTSPKQIITMGFLASFKGIQAEAKSNTAVLLSSADTISDPTSSENTLAENPQGSPREPFNLV